jgi:predicted amidohydrolase YtcJ
LGELRDLPPGTLRIEHFSYAREEDFARAVQLGVTLSIQSNFNSGPDDSPTFGAMRVGEANEARVYAWRRLFEMNAALVEGSDYFARPGEPLAGFLAAMSRRNAVGLGHDDSATRAAVYRMHASAAGGDSVVWSGDPMTLPLDQLSTVRSRRTTSAGRLTWQEDSPR